MGNINEEVKVGRKGEEGGSRKRESWEEGDEQCFSVCLTWSTTRDGIKMGGGLGHVDWAWGIHGSGGVGLYFGFGL